MKDNSIYVENSAVVGIPLIILRLEGLALLAAAVLGYVATKGSWPFFFLCFLLPDLSFLGYLLGPKIGAGAYNALHSTVLPVTIGAIGGPATWPYSLIWLAHIGFDRAAGYGLKYSSAFGETHLGRLGPKEKK